MNAAGKQAVSTQENETHSHSNNFLAWIEGNTPGDSRLSMCIQCGTCGGSCPSGPDMDHSPRQIFAMIQAGLDEDALSSNTPWYCVSCYLCTVRCPQEIHITEIMYTLKSKAIEEGKAQIDAAKVWSETFIGYVEQYGRSFELGLATRHYLRHRPMGMTRAASLGVGMLAKGRIDLTPQVIDDVGQLRLILWKAKELEARQ